MRSCKTFGRVCWLLPWTRAAGTRCASPSFRRSSKLDPLDALVLKAIRDNGNSTWSPSGRDVIAGKLHCSSDEVLVSFKHLAELDCIYFTDSSGPRIQPYMKSFGTLLMNVVNG